MSNLVILKNEKDFAHFRFKKSFSSPSLRLRMALGNQNITRFGFIIPKKVLPKATDRNKVKRRLKYILLASQSHIKAADILIFPQKSSLKLKVADLAAELIADIKRLNLWKL